MESLNETTAPPALLAHLRVGAQLRAKLRQRDFLLFALASLAGAGVLLALGLGAIILVLLQNRTQFVGYGSDGTVWISESRSFGEARELHAEMASLATAALLWRGPKDFHLADLRPRLFSTPALGLAERLRREEQADFEDRQLRQEPEIASIEAQSVNPGWVELTVIGQLVRNGTAAGQPIRDVLPFTLRLTLSRNSNLLRAGRYPVIVTAFTLSYDSPRR